MSLAFDLGRRARPRLARIGDLPIETLSLAETAQAFVDYCLSEARRAAPRPLYSTSVNGQVISQCASDRQLARLMGEADSISADGQPLVILSKYLCRNPLPERVATTDLFPQTAALAEKAGVSFYLLGSTEDVNARASEAVRKAYPQPQTRRAAARLFLARRRGRDLRRNRGAQTGHSVGLARRAPRATVLPAQSFRLARRRHRQDRRRPARLRRRRQTAGAAMDAEGRARVALSPRGRAATSVLALCAHQPARPVRHAADDAIGRA